MQGSAPRGPTEPVVRLESVSKYYGRFKAVDGLSLDVGRGEILTLLGPSGCGKTTTLRMVIGLEKASSGRVRHNERVVDDPAGGVFVPAHRRNMGMVFQSYAIWPHMTVAENVAYPLRVRGVRGEELRRKVAAALDLVGLSGLGERPAPDLSGGQQQRVALARSLVFEPSLLLLDEPFSNLDAKLREQMRGEVKVLQRRLGITVLFVTHDQVEALSLSDRIAVMHGGRIEQIGAPEELYRRPASAVVRDFLGRILLMDGVVRERGAGQAVVALAGDPGRIIVVRQVVGALAVGDRCCLALRPEHAVLEPQRAGADDAGGNVLGGVVEAMLFMGDRYEARIRLPWEQSAVINVAPENAPAEGDRVLLRLPEERLQAWQA